MQDQDLANIVDTLFSFAKRLHADGGDVLTTGAPMDTNGNIALSTCGDPQIHPNTPEGRNMVVGALRMQAKSGSIRAAGLLLDVTLQPPGKPQSDGIRIIAEHKDGQAIDLYVPYQKDTSGKFEYGEMFGQPWKNRLIFLPA